uniref:(northern house mosquito) hypothetical protein n=1 Tax=Culex pipiens TaxID=7175 RepID=A0A8D8AWQ6_CULPI
MATLVQPPFWKNQLIPVLMILFWMILLVTPVNRIASGAISLIVLFCNMKFTNPLSEINSLSIVPILQPDTVKCLHKSFSVTACDLSTPMLQFSNTNESILLTSNALVKTSLMFVLMNLISLKDALNSHKLPMPQFTMSSLVDTDPRNASS